MQQQDLPNLNEKIKYLENQLLSCYGDTPDNLSSLKQRFAYFKTSLKEKWSKAHRKEAVFLKTNEAWLEGTFELSANKQTRPGRPSNSLKILVRGLKEEKQKKYVLRLVKK